MNKIFKSISWPYLIGFLWIGLLILDGGRIISLPKGLLRLGSILFFIGWTIGTIKGYREGSLVIVSYTVELNKNGRAMLIFALLINIGLAIGILYSAFWGRF